MAYLIKPRLQSRRNIPILEPLPYQRPKYQHPAFAILGQTGQNSQIISVPPAPAAFAKWCEKEKGYIPSVDWTEEKCVPKPWYKQKWVKWAGIGTAAFLLLRR